jgi:hypothetical protein
MSNDERKWLSAGSMGAKILVDGKLVDIPKASEPTSMPSGDLGAFDFSKIGALDGVSIQGDNGVIDFIPTEYGLPLEANGGAWLPLGTKITITHEGEPLMRLIVVKHDHERGVMVCKRVDQP